MSRRTVIIIGAIICSAIVASLVYWFMFRKTETVTDEPSREYKQAPNFNLPDASGNMVDLGNVESDVKIITFWASWNPYSADELRTFNRIEDEYGDTVAIVALNRDTYPEDGKQFLQNENIRNNLIFVYDRDDGYYHLVDGFAVPETLFLNREGDIVFHKHGPISETEIKAHIENIQ